MPELRKDPVTGRWVIISTERAFRPKDFKISDEEKKNNGECPFCPGNEHKTPPEVLSYRPNGGMPNTPGWNIRVVPNKYPALHSFVDLNRQGEGIFDKMSGVGIHEVIIETPDHNDTLSSMPVKGVEDVFWAIRDRLLEIKKDKRFKYVMVFKNHGSLAGASLYHSHSQLVALPIVPKRVMEEIAEARQYYELKERCIFCDIIKQEIKENVRNIVENDDFIAISPYAPRFPFETWILPKNHSHAFEENQVHEMENLASILKDFLERVTKILHDPPYNLILHNSPFIDGVKEIYHWHIEFMPTLTKVAGFEWGTGFYINPTPPEDSARYLKKAK
ncbi:MAG: galactose-1-phosphate uridylyltransferase [Candidatus Aminicenantia bacterium]